MTGMDHGEPPAERLKALASFGSRFGGHVVVMNLMKRFELLTQRRTPAGVEYDWGDRYAVLWDRLARAALDGPVGMIEVTRGQLWRMAKWLIEAVDDEAHAAMASRCEEYPEGWLAMADLIRADRVPMEITKEAPEQCTHSPQAALNALDIAATRLGVSEQAVLRGAGLTKPLGEGAEQRIMEWYESRKRGTDR